MLGRHIANNNILPPLIRCHGFFLLCFSMTVIDTCTGRWHFDYYLSLALGREEVLVQCTTRRTFLLSFLLIRFTVFYFIVVKKQPF